MVIIVINLDVGIIVEVQIVEMLLDVIGYQILIVLSRVEDLGIIIIKLLVN